MKRHLSLLQQLKQQPKLGGAPKYIDPDAKTALQIQADLNLLSKSFSNVGVGIDNLAELYQKFQETNLSLGLGINKLAGFQDSFNKKIVEGVKEATFLEQRNASLAKALGIHGKVAFDLGKKYDELNTHLMTGGEAIRVFGINLNKIAPGYAKAIAGTAKMANANNDFGNNLLMTQRILTKNIGLSEDAANSYELFAAGVGVDSTAMIDYQRNLSEQIEKSTGMTNQFASIVSDISGLGADIQMQFGKMPGNLELAVLKSRQLGMTFDKIDAAATNALNIETSIGQEIEYQLLSGQRLVDQSGRSLTQKMREAKIMGDANKMAEATAEIFESQNKVLEGNNFYAQEQLAAVMGLTRADMMRAYQQQKLQKKIEDASKGLNEKIDINALMKMDTADIIATLKTTSMTTAEQAQVLKDIQENTAPQTTDEMLSELLKMARTDGIKVQGKTITFAAQRTAGLDLKEATIKMTDFARSEPFAQVYGGLQALKQVPTEELTAFAGTLPLAAKAVTALTTALNNLTSPLSFKEGTSGTTTDTDPTSINNDAIIMNDGIVRFNPADKFMKVNDSTMIAGTNVDGNRQLARAITGTSDNSKMISAIRSALQGMSIHVHVDPMKIRDEIKFNDRGIN